MCDNCKYKSNQIEIDNSSLDMLRSQPKIEIIEVEADYGTQLKFAVPDSGMNEPNVDVIEELRGEISDFFMGLREIMIKNYGKYSNTVVVIHDMYSKEIMEIIEKYRK